MARPQKNPFESSTDVKNHLANIYVLLRKDEINEKKARALVNVLNGVQQSIWAELKEREIEAQEELAEQIKKSTGDK